MKRLMVATAALLLAAACGPNRPPAAEPAPVSSRVLLGDQHSFFDVAWLPDGWLVLNKSGPNVFDNAPTLWRVHPDGSELVKLPLPTSSSKCRRFLYMRPTTLPNGHVGFLHWCDVQGSDRTILSLAAYDAAKQRAVPLMSKPLGYNPDQLTWNPAMTQGLFGVTSSICAGMGAMTRRGTADLALSVLAGGRLYPVQENLSLPGDADCSATIRADMPAWSPDGDRIAFLASPDSIGKAGLTRAYAPWSLYFVDPDGQHPVPVQRGLVNPHGTAWSPDGHWLAYSGEVAGRGDGIWLYRIADGKLVRVISGTFGGMAWSPDGSAMAATREMKTSGDELVHTELRILDLRRITTSGP